MLVPVPAQFIDRAWKEGADRLAKACEGSGGEITGDQLKMILSRGERTLLRMDHEGETVGWGVVRVDQLPNMRVLFITDMAGVGYDRFFGDIKELAASLGCSRIRCAARPAQARLYRMKTNFQPVYSILEVEV